MAPPKSRQQAVRVDACEYATIRINWHCQLTVKCTAQSNKLSPRPAMLCPHFNEFNEPCNLRATNWLAVKYLCTGTGTGTGSGSATGIWHQNGVQPFESLINRTSDIRLTFHLSPFTCRCRCRCRQSISHCKVGPPCVCVIHFVWSAKCIRLHSTAE